MTVKSSSSGTDALARKVYDLAPDAPVTNEQRKDLRKALRGLPVQYSKVMRLRYGIGINKPMTKMAIGKNLGMSQATVSLIKKRSLEALKTGGKVKVKRFNQNLKQLRSRANAVFHGLNEAALDDVDEVIKSRRQELDAAMVALEPVQAFAIELTFGIENGKRHSISDAAKILNLKDNQFCKALRIGLTGLFDGLQTNASGQFFDTPVSALAAQEIKIEDTTNLSTIEARSKIQEAFKRLSRKQLQIIKACFPLSDEDPQSNVKIAKATGQSRQNVDNIKRTALRKLSQNPKLRDFAPNS